MGPDDLANLGWINAALLAVAGAFALARRPAAEEHRIRLLEALAVAARRGVPLAPVVERAAQEEGRRRRAAMERTAEELESGTPLAEALAACRALRFRSRTIDALRVADGTPALAGVLESVARDEAATRARRQRPWADALYVAVVAACVLPVARFAAERLEQIHPLGTLWMRIPRGAPAPAPGGATPAAWAIAAAWFGLTFAALAALVVPVAAPWLSRPGAWRLGGWSVTGEFPPFRTPSREAGLGRFFASLAAHLRSGAPLGVAARAASASSWNRGVRRGALRFADDVERGESADTAWKHLPLRVAVRCRAAAACTGSAARAADAFERLADESRARVALWVESRSRWIVPVGLLALGCAALLLFTELMGLLAECRRTALREFRP